VRDDLLQRIANVVCLAALGFGTSSACGGARRTSVPALCPVERFAALGREIAAMEGNVATTVKAGTHEGRPVCLVLVQAVPGGPGRHRGVVLTPDGILVQLIKGQ
jgi:hypothetical protein